MNDKDLNYLREAIQESEHACDQGDMPFGAILVDAAGNIVLRQRNVQLSGGACTGHAESMLMTAASRAYPPEFLWNCTLYASTEPCAMCAGAIYWGNVGRVVFALSEQQVTAMIGGRGVKAGFDLPCREVFARGKKMIAVSGPVEQLRIQASQAFARLLAK